jgi:hypothetical protein
VQIMVTQGVMFVKVEQLWFHDNAAAGAAKSTAVFATWLYISKYRTHI